jgi:hypothetical protein
MRLTSFHVRAIAFLTLGAALAAAAAPKVHAQAPASTDVKVERIKPEREKYETVRFLKQNRDFVRRRFDLLREKPVGASGDAGSIDPRYLEYSKMLAAVLADRDSVTRAAEARDRLTLLASITELGQLETQLDQMDRLLAAQRGRLGILQNDFTGRQQTALVVVASGWPAGATVDSITIALEDGSRTTVTLTDAQRASLRDGGVLQLFHGFVEPRQQAFELTLAGNRWAAPAPAWVTLDPARDRITFLKLDLSTVAQGGAADMSARTWIHDESLPPGDS